LRTIASKREIQYCRQAVESPEPTPWGTGHVPPLLQMDAHGDTVSRKIANKKLTKLLTITKALTRTTHSTVEPTKKWTGKEKNTGAFRRSCASPSLPYPPLLPRSFNFFSVPLCGVWCQVLLIIDCSKYLHF